MDEVVVDSFNKLIDALAKYKNDWRWVFRGESKASGRALLPVAGRPDYREAREIGSFEDWKIRAIAFVEKTPDNDWDWLAIARHYDLPTRLLDWTPNPLAAAFFAVFRDGNRPDGDAVIYVYYAESVVTHVDPEVAEQFKYIIPCNSVSPFTGFENEVVRFRPRAHIERIRTLSSMFTTHCPPTLSLQDYVKTNKRVKLERIVIKENFRDTLLRDLFYYGIDPLSLSPDMSGLTRKYKIMMSKEKVWFGLNPNDPYT